jgi:hypothetical protein
MKGRSIFTKRKRKNRENPEDNQENDTPNTYDPGKKKEEYNNYLIA